MRRRRRFLWVGGVTLALLALFLFWLGFRGGRTVERPLVALLPEGTAVALQLHRLSDLLEAYDSTALANLLANDVEVGALLLDQDAYREWRETHAEIELRTHLRLGRQLLLDWAGREVTVAYVPAPNESHPGLVVLTQARLGFKERLAELVAQLYPGARLQTSEHRGTPITSWIGDHSRDSLSLCRFGETVALSLRSDSTSYLRAIIDAVNAPNPPEQPAFPPPEVPGVHAWIRPDLFPDFLRSLRSDDLGELLASEEGEEILALWDHIEEARLTFTLDAPRQIRLEMRVPPGALPPVETDDSWLGFTRRQTLGTVHLEKPSQWWLRFRHLLVDFSIGIDPDWSEERARRHREKRQWRVRFANWIEGEVLPLLDGPATLVLDSIVPRMGIPAVRGALIWETSQPDRLRATLDTVLSDGGEYLFAGIDETIRPDWLLPPSSHRTVGELEFPNWDTAIGRVGWTVWDNCLLVTMEEMGTTFTEQLMQGWPSALPDQAAHQAVAALWGAAPRIGEIYLHTQPLSPLSAALLLNPSWWNESGQRYLQRLRLANSLFMAYPAMGVALQRDTDALRLVLAVAATGEVTVD